MSVSAPWGRAASAVLLAAAALGWLDPDHTAREGNRLYAEGKYEEAAGQYNQALTDKPDSPLLHFNLGDAHYKQGKFTDALTAFQQVPAGDAEPARTARVAYNVGNTKYRLGAAAETSDPKQALSLYAEALAAYRRALGVAPDDMDTKFNHEFVEKKLAELKKRLEQQQQQQQQQQGDQGQQGDQQQDQKEQQEGQEQQQRQQQQQGAGEQPPEEPKDEQEAQGQQPQEAQPGEGQGQAAGAPGEEADEKSGEMSQQEAAALLDSQRDQEVRPDEIVKRLQGAAVAEPGEDW
jgi:tetratricopeptide (TPR) repeat protein